MVSYRRRQSTSIARHHAEWLSLLDISGPFLSMPVLLRVFPQGLEPDDVDLKRELRAAYEEWLDNQGSTRPAPAIHRAWAEWVLRSLLEMPNEVLLRDPETLSAFAVPVAEQGETLLPDMVVAEPPDSPSQEKAIARLLVQVVPKAQGLESPLTGHLWKASPAMRMMALLHATGVVLGLVTNGEQWMLVHAPRGETTGYISWYTELWLAEPLTLRAFRTLLRAYRFYGVPDEETIEGLLTDSANQQQELTDQLGYQVRRAVELLVEAFDRANSDSGDTLLAGVTEQRLYDAALTVMMRLIFLLSAEERGLLLLGDPIYDQHYAVSTLRAQLHEFADQSGDEVLERRYDSWCRLLATFRAVYSGIQHHQLHLPAYGGDLFDPDRYPFMEGRTLGSTSDGAAADPLPIDNRTVLHLLDALQMLKVPVPGGPAEARRLSFRALDIEQIGHVYEGLLDHTARRASEPVLGLSGSRNREPEIPISTLEEALARGEDSFLKYLKAETGRSMSALRKTLEAGAELERAPRLRTACGNAVAVYGRILPFAGLIRDDDYGRPVIVLPGHVYVTSGDQRRATGTHYTPRSLTEPMVQHTLEPLVYEGPAQGLDRDHWKLRGADELLDLKVCDMAVGSGAFLVQACRYLSERIVEAWETRETNLSRRHRGARILITPHGERAADPDAAIPAGVEERLRLARRLVADRCLYGVDKNPMAVDMAKLSLWLITLERNKPFTFLDHALKCGDSLVGVNLRQLQYWDLNPDPDAVEGYQPFGTALDIEKVIEIRREIASMPDLDIRNRQVKAAKLREAEFIIYDLRVGADLLIASYFSDKSTRDAAELRSKLWRVFRIGADVPKDTPNLSSAVPGGLDPFHWELEFPEVFLDQDRDGFDAFVGNPPFMGGQRISGAVGSTYLAYLKRWQNNKSGSVDLCCYFYLRAFEKLRNGGAFGLIATNTIAQGSTRKMGLDQILEAGGTIYRADNDYHWPGQAAVVVNVVHVRKGTWQGVRILDDKPVKTISAYLDRRAVVGSPHRLTSNAGKSFQGSNVLGMGFVLEPEETRALIDRDPRNRDVLFPYLNGEDLNSRPDQSPSRWVINFFDWPLDRSAQGSWLRADNRKRRTWLRAGCVPSDYREPVAADYPDCLYIARDRVYPERRLNRNKQRREIWWRFTRPTMDLYKAIAPLRWVLAVAQTSRTLAFAFVPKGWVYSMMTIVFAHDEYWAFAILQSAFHESWARAYCSTMKQDLRYTPTDVFGTYPFPDVRTTTKRALSEPGDVYHQHRGQVMLARHEGLTRTYNRFHDSEESAEDIARLRELHVEMDHAVADAYGWDDLDLGHGFHEMHQGLRYTISDEARYEVLDRLLALNHQRYQEELRLGSHRSSANGNPKRLLL